MKKVPQGGIVVGFDTPVVNSVPGDTTVIAPGDTAVTKAGYMVVVVGSLSKAFP